MKRRAPWLLLEAIDLAVVGCGRAPGSVPAAVSAEAAGAAAITLASQLMDDELRERLLRFELALATRYPSGIEGGLMSLIAEDFVEFGSSGRVWTRESMREVLEGPPASAVSMGEVEARFEVAELADGVALVTYGGPNVNRSSIWVRTEHGWRIRFHQGTAIPSGGPEHPGDQAAGKERQPE